MCISPSSNVDITVCRELIVVVGMTSHVLGLRARFSAPGNVASESHLVWGHKVPEPLLGFDTRNSWLFHAVSGFGSQTTELVTVLGFIGSAWYTVLGCLANVQRVLGPGRQQAHV